MGRVGSSMNFSWTFIGDPVTINWGIKKAGANDFESNGLILSVAKDGTQRVENQGYNGRANEYGVETHSLHKWSLLLVPLR